VILNLVSTAMCWMTSSQLMGRGGSVIGSVPYVWKVTGSNSILATT